MMEPNMRIAREETREIVTVEIDPISRLSDRELLEYIAHNMLTVDKVVDELIIRLPEVLGAMDSSPMIKTLLKLIG